MINVPKNSIFIKRDFVIGLISALIMIMSCQSIGATPILQLTATDAILNTTTPASKPLATSTTIPTLTSDEAQKIMHKLLMSNGDCIDLCFWEIFPGVSTDKEVLKKFKQLGIDGYEVTDQNENLSHYDTRLDMFTQNTIVISIDFENGVVSNVLAEIYYLGKQEITHPIGKQFL